MVITVIACCCAYCFGLLREEEECHGKKEEELTGKLGMGAEGGPLSEARESVRATSRLQNGCRAKASYRRIEEDVRDVALRRITL